ncbi:helix-turn-helix transcriptional regulator [Sinorhizobium meliloti]|uniref:helix-turn-helix transcriptional regulator n=1 Tax=Rhizobium meliloti TaxID=382 RepID=UPI000FDBEFFC|nr:AlpA family phage regulatory protein [Sinorhizobium meliloti]RVM95951.1 AlpA family phage regulatory protein [Sinorhizobium meliloti]
MSGQHHNARDRIAPIQRRKKIIRAKEMPDETGLAMRSIWEQVSEGTLPAPIQIGPRAVGWLADEIEAWREEKRRERDLRLAGGVLRDDLKDAQALPRRQRGRPRKDDTSIDAFK